MLEISRNNEQNNHTVPPPYVLHNLKKTTVMHYWHFKN